MTSPGPPAENGTTSVIGRLGIFLGECRQRRRQQQHQQNSFYKLHGSFLSALWPLNGLIEVTGYSSAVAFSFGADDCSIMLSAATAAALM